MYEWSPVTDRVESIHKKVRDRVIQVDTERGLLATEADKANQHVIPIIRRARILRHQLENMTIRV